MVADSNDFLSLLPDIYVDMRTSVKPVEIGYYRSLFPEKQGPINWEGGIVISCRHVSLVKLNFGVGREFSGKPMALNKIEEDMVICLMDQNALSEYKLNKCEDPVVINEDGWHCIWFCFKKGIASFYLNQI